MSTHNTELERQQQDSANYSLGAWLGTITADSSDDDVNNMAKAYSYKVGIQMQALVSLALFTQRRVAILERELMLHKAGV